MQEREELRALKREKKMSREGKIKRIVCVWKRKKNRKEKREKIYMKGRRRIKREKRSGKKYMRGMNQVKRKNKSARKDVTLLRDETFTLFPTMCNPTTRTSSVSRSHIFFCPCTCPPF
jgi:hypothetical protein